MKKQTIYFALVAILGIGFLCYQTAVAFWEFPPLPPPEQYGNILINRTSEKNNIKPVTFSHWSHRMHYTCTVCHLELEFNMKLNTTEITEADNKAGRYCGACHDGKIAFSHDRENCDKCHNGDITYGSEKFSKIKTFPATRFGNKVDWVKIMSNGVIKPKKFLHTETPSVPFKKTLWLEAEWVFVPPSIFPHEAHTDWIDCSICHPDIFNIKKKTTKHFSMDLILKGKFCGVCHLNVAFPLNDCKRCHPAMQDY